ncbi:MAG: dienelactone hydrolase family protein [Limnohabitans sp.]|nr:dienelactone hydrolase family protein [Limnohabitans sp.]
MNFSHVFLAACAALCAGCVLFGQDTKPPAAATPETVAAADPFAKIASGETLVADPSGKGEVAYRYRLIEPLPEAIADPGARVPLVVFLHGSGERGSDNRAQLKHFAGACASDEFQTKAPCYLLAMQCPAGETWSPIDIKAMRERGETPKAAKEPTRAMRALMQAIDEVVATKAVDPTRVYLTGLSMGGFGAFDLAARRPCMFAAVVPICGGGDPATAATVARVPFYIVHGTDDPVVPVALSRAMREAIAGAAAEAARVDHETAREKAREATDAPKPMPKRAPNPMYREYDKVGHDSWTPAYRFGDDGVLDWMFAQRKS